MEIAVSEAKAQLTDLVRRAEEGEDVTLTRHGRPVAQIVPAKRRRSAAEFRAALRALAEEGGRKAIPGPDAAHASDFLFGPDGMPE
jgi:prevent-host-death family protein